MTGAENDKWYWRNLQSVNSATFHAASQFDSIYRVPTFDKFVVNVFEKSQINKYQYFDSVGRLKYQPNTRLYATIGANGKTYPLRLNNIGYRKIE